MPVSPEPARCPGTDTPGRQHGGWDHQLAQRKPAALEGPGFTRVKHPSIWEMVGWAPITNVHVQLRNPLKKFACRCACYFVGSIEILPLKRPLECPFPQRIPSAICLICEFLGLMNRKPSKNPAPALPFFKQQNLCMQNVCLQCQVTSYMIVCDLNMFHYHCTPVNKKK